MPLLGYTIPGVSPGGQAAAELAASFIGAGLLSWFRSRYDSVATWALSSEDDVFSLAGITLEGDGPPESFRQVDVVNVVPASGFQVHEPVTMPISSEASSWDLTHLYVSDNRTQDLRIVERILRQYRTVQRELRRQPILRLQYGDLNERVWLVSLETEYPHGTWPGSDIPIALRISARFTRANLRRLRERPRRPRETTYRVLRAGETFEDLALEYYGDPEMGVVLRRINPDLLEEYPGARVKVLDRDHPKVRESTAPAGPAFMQRRSELVNAIVAAKAERGAPSWAALEAEAVVSDGTPSLYDAGV